MSKGLEVSSEDSYEDVSVTLVAAPSRRRFVSRTPSESSKTKTSVPVAVPVPNAVRRDLDSKDIERRFLSEPVSSEHIVSSDRLLSLRRRLRLVKGGSKAGLRAEVKLYDGFSASVNSAAGKYCQFLAGSSSLLWNNILSNCDAFADLEAIFNEFFVRSITLEYQPINKSSSNSTASNSSAGNPGDINTCGATIYMVPHKQAAYSDTSTAFFQAREPKYSKYVNMAEKWKLVAKNDEKFSWDGPVGDATTAGSNMQWMTFPQAAAYGGLFALITPVSAAAAASVTQLLENGIFGFIVATVDIAVRARI